MNRELERVDLYHRRENEYITKGLLFIIKHVLFLYFMIQSSQEPGFIVKTRILIALYFKKPKTILMKHAILVSAAALLLLSACNNNKKPGEITVKSDDGKTTATIDPNAASQSAEMMQKKVEELQKLPPYTLDQIKAMLPEELMGAKRTRFSANSAMGTAVGNAEYKINDTSSVSLSIFDCAGQAGAGVYNMQYIMAMNLQSESDEESTKTVDFKGTRAVENIHKNSGRAVFTWLAADRLLVTLDGDNVGIDALRSAADGLSFK